MMKKKISLILLGIWGIVGSCSIYGGAIFKVTSSGELEFVAESSDPNILGIYIYKDSDCSNLEDKLLSLGFLSDDEDANKDVVILSNDEEKWEKARERLAALFAQVDAEIDMITQEDYELAKNLFELSEDSDLKAKFLQLKFWWFLSCFAKLDLEDCSFNARLTRLQGYLSICKHFKNPLSTLGTNEDPTFFIYSSFANNYIYTLFSFYVCSFTRSSEVFDQYIRRLECFKSDKPYPSCYRAALQNEAKMLAKSLEKSVVIINKLREGQSEAESDREERMEYLREKKANKLRFIVNQSLQLEAIRPLVLAELFIPEGSYSRIDHKEQVSKDTLDILLKKVNRMVQGIEKFAALTEERWKYDSRRKIRKLRKEQSRAKLNRQERQEDLTIMEEVKKLELTVDKLKILVPKFLFQAELLIPKDSYKSAEYKKQASKDALGILLKKESSTSILEELQRKFMSGSWDDLIDSSMEELQRNPMLNSNQVVKVISFSQIENLQYLRQLFYKIKFNQFLLLCKDGIKKEDLLESQKMFYKNLPSPKNIVKVAKKRIEKIVGDSHRNLSFEEIKNLLCCYINLFVYDCENPTAENYDYCIKLLEYEKKDRLEEVKSLAKEALCLCRELDIDAETKDTFVKEIGKVFASLMNKGK